MSGAGCQSKAAEKRDEDNPVQARDGTLSLHHHQGAFSSQLNFTEDGFCPFKNEPFLVIPYDKMSSMQLVLIQEIIRHCKTSKNYMACSRMGVGSSVFMLETSGSDRPLDVAVVLFGLYQLISNSNQNKKQQVDVYNIMTQRLMKSVLIPPE